MTRSALRAAFWLALLLPGHQLLEAQAAAPVATPAAPAFDLPDAPQPRIELSPCPPKMTRGDAQETAPAVAIASLNGNDGNPGNAAGAPASIDPQPAPSQQNQNKTRPGFPPAAPPALGRPPVPSASRAGIPHRSADCIPQGSSPAERFMSCNPQVNMYQRFLSYSQPFVLSPKQKLILAYRNIRDPFNLLTIFGEAAISVASNAESAYGPGMRGFAKYAGVSLTEDASAEFFGTFLIPSLAHQDPHYVRMPNLSMRRRVVHVIDAVAIGHGDDGLPMFNYAEVFGTIATSALGNLYVPGRRTDWGASADRVSVALATDPIGNAITEFLPDVARRININVVLVQRVINRVAIEEGGAGAQ